MNRYIPVINTSLLIAIGGALIMLVLVSPVAPVWLAIVATLPVFAALTNLGVFTAAKGTEEQTSFSWLHSAKPV